MTEPGRLEVESAYEWLTIPDDAQRARMRHDAVDPTALLVDAVHRYLGHPQPLFSRSPISYRHVPLPVRMALLRLLARRARSVVDAFPGWPIERSVDDAIRLAWADAATRPGVSLQKPGYAGRAAAIAITHDIDTAGDARRIGVIRDLERRFGLASAFGFVPRSSWPTEGQVRDLIADGCEAYWHDIAHDGRLPWLASAAIRSVFERVADSSPWAVETMRAFRSGQLLMSGALLEIVAERFEVDLSFPDTERFGPYGSSAGCGTVFPFRIRGLLEIPLTMPQDAYLRNVHRLSPDAVIEVWTTKLAYIVSIGGVAVLNVHPVWVNPDDRAMWSAYERFLAHIAERTDVLATTPVALARLIQGGLDRAGPSGPALADPG